MALPTRTPRELALFAGAGGGLLGSAILGQLSPMWVEWLMGFPIGWTALQPLEIAKFREFLQQHGDSSVMECDAHAHIEARLSEMMLQREEL